LDEVLGKLVVLNQLHLLDQEHVSKGLQFLKDKYTINGVLSWGKDGSSIDLRKLHYILECLIELRENYDIEPVGTAVLEYAAQHLPGGNEDSVPDPTLISLMKRFGGKKSKLTANQYMSTAEALLPLKYSTDVSEIAAAYDSLRVIRDSKPSQYFTGLKKNSFDLNKKIELEIQVVDLLGNHVGFKTVTLTTLKMIGKDGALMQDTTMPTGKIDLSKENLSVGRFTASMLVELENGDSTKLQTSFVVQERVSVEAVYAWVSESKQSTRSDADELKSQKSFSESMSSVEYFNAEFKISAQSGRKPHQVFLKFVSQETGFTVVSLEQPTDDGHFGYRFSLNLLDEIENFKRMSGAYTASILVADVAYMQGVEWVIGTLKLSFPTKPSPSYPLYAKSLLYTSDVSLKPLPEFSHQMRPPPKRANSIMSMLFTCVMFVPLLGFIGFTISLKPNVAKLNSLSSLLLFGLFSVLLLLYGGYWLGFEGMAFYKTIKSLCFLYPILMLVWRYSLGSTTHVMKTESKE
jgi:hypothetical protein